MPTTCAPQRVATSAKRPMPQPTSRTNFPARSSGRNPVRRRKARSDRLLSAVSSCVFAWTCHWKPKLPTYCWVSTKRKMPLTYGYLRLHPRQTSSFVRSSRRSRQVRQRRIDKTLSASKGCFWPNDPVIGSLAENAFSIPLFVGERLTGDPHHGTGVSHHEIRI